MTTTGNNEHDDNTNANNGNSTSNSNDNSNNSNNNDNTRPGHVRLLLSFHQSMCQKFTNSKYVSAAWSARHLKHAIIDLFQVKL